MLDLTPGRVLERVTLGNGRAHSEASLCELRGAENTVLLTDVYVPPSRRERGEMRFMVKTLSEIADARGWDIFTYVHPHGRGPRPSPHQLWAFYLRSGYAPGPEHAEAGPLEQLLVRSTRRTYLCSNRA